MSTFVGVITDGDSNSVTSIVVSTTGIEDAKAAIEEKFDEGDKYEWLEVQGRLVFFPVNDSGGYFSTASIYSAESGKLFHLLD